MQAFFSVFPAQAGMIPLLGAKTKKNFRIPRASGDDPTPPLHTILYKWYSPRKRG